MSGLSVEQAHDGRGADTPSPVMGLLSRLSAFVQDWRFPVLMLATLLFFHLFVAFLLLVPEHSPLGAYAEDFKIWCFRYDPATGHINWIYVFTFFTGPLILVYLLVTLWKQPLRAALGKPRALIPYLLVSLVLTGAIARGLLILPVAANDTELPFPAESLRTRLRAPAFALVNQASQPVSLAALRGRVLLLTAAYAHCRSTCPLVLQQARASVEQLSPAQQRDVTVVAVTLDPGRDDVAALRQLANLHGLTAPRYHLVTGEPRAVESLLDDLSIPRRLDPRSGDIIHANYFILVDRQGQIAYRLTLGNRHRNWLPQALKGLIKEKA